MPTIKELAERRGKLVGAESSREKRKEAADAGLKAREAALQGGAKPRDAAATGEAAQQKVFADERARINNPLGAGDGNREVVGGQAFQPGRDSGVVPEGFRDGGFESQAQQAQEAFDKLREEAKGLSQSYQDAIETLTGVLGEQKDLFAKQMEAIQKQTGMAVDTTDPEFQGAIKAAAEAADAAGEVDFTGVFKEFLVPQEQMRTTEDVEQLKKAAVDAGVSKDRIEEAEKEVETGEPFFNEKDFVEFLKQGIRSAGKELAITEPVSSQNPAEVMADVTPENTNAGVNTNVVEEMPEAEQISVALNNITQMSPGDLEMAVGDMIFDVSQATGAEILQSVITQQKLDAINNPMMSQYFDMMADRATQSYLASINEGERTAKEIAKAISGESFSPTTLDGVMAKAYTEAKNIGLQTIEEEREYLKTQRDLWMKQESEKRGRLEGYLKGKLYAMGAQDSSAGLSLMAAQVNAADLRMQAQESEYNRGLSKLNLGAKEVMSNFTSSIGEIVIKAQARKETAQSDYEDKMFEVMGLRIEDADEKRQLTLNALGEFRDNMYKIEQDQKAEERWQFEQSYKAMRDNIEDAVKISNLTGTIYSVDESGNLVDTKIPTFEAKKWEATNWLNTKKFEHTLSNDGWNMAMDLLDLGGSDAIAAAEVLAGMPEGSLSSLGTAMDRKEALSSYIEGGRISKELLLDVAGENGVIASMYEEGAYGGQCGAFVHKFVSDYPYGLNTLQQKMSAINSQVPKVGSVVILDESYPGTNTGHVAVINKIDEDGTLILTESNYAKNETVSNTRRVAPDYPKIKGYFEGTLKPEIQGAFKSLAESKVEDYVDRVRDGEKINDVVGDIKNEVSDTTLRAKIIEEFNTQVRYKEPIKLKKSDLAGTGLEPYASFLVGARIPSLYGREQYRAEMEELEDELED